MKQSAVSSWRLGALAGLFCPTPEPKTANSLPRCLVPCPSCKHPCWSHFSCGCCGECKECQAVHFDVRNAAAHPVHS